MINSINQNKQRSWLTQGVSPWQQLDQSKCFGLGMEVTKWHMVGEGCKQTGQDRTGTHADHVAYTDT